MRKLALSLGVILLGCSPKVMVNSLDSAPAYPLIASHESFVIFEKDTVGFDSESLIGAVEIKDGGLGINCDFESVKALARAEARKMGGNVLVITEHKLPTQFGSSCHRIKGEVYRIANPEAYESEVVWHQQRKLKLSDFKGATEKRPFLAATASSFRYLFNQQPFAKSFKVTAEAFFDCKSSYFKRSEYDSMTLAHEQLHFDLSEIYARQFIKRLQAEVHSLQDMLSQHQNILNEIGRELQLKQDEYDSEVYVDETQQSKWKEWVENKLAETAKYADKTLEISVK